AASLAVVAHHKMTHWGDTLLVLSPEHVRIPGDAGWTKAEVRRWLWERLQRPVRELLPGRDGGEGLPEHVLRKFPDPARDDSPPVEPRRPGRHPARHLEGEGRPPPRPDRGAPARARAPEGDREEEEADLRAPGARVPARGDRRRDRRPDRGARRLRVVHHVQC